MERQFLAAGFFSAPDAFECTPNIQDSRPSSRFEFGHFGRSGMMEPKKAMAVKPCLLRTLFLWWMEAFDRAIGDGSSTWRPCGIQM